MLCSTVGSGAAGTDNEEQTFAGLGAAAVGGPRLQAITAGGFYTSKQEDGKKKGRREEGNKDLQLNVVDALKEKKNHSLQKINEDAEQLDVRHIVFMSVRQRMNGNKNQRSLNH